MKETKDISVYEYTKVKKYYYQTIYEFNILVTYGTSNSYPKLETNTDGSLKFPVGYVYMEDYYNSHICIHNNIVMKNQTNLDITEINKLL